jgi:hypothetical protein
MKTKEQAHKDFDAVAFFRNVKEQIAKELEGKTFEQQKAILSKLLSGDVKLKTPATQR